MSITSDTAVDLLLRFHPDVVDTTMALVDAHSDRAMPHALAAYLHLMSSDHRDLAGARHHAAALRQHARTEHERAHERAVRAWLDGDWRGAAAALDDLLVAWPDDLLALMIGHQLDFYLGDARNLRDRVARSLRALDPDDPRTGFVHGMLAFGLEESGTYDRALDIGLDAVDRNPDDVWAIHAVAHVHEMRGDVAAGIDFLEPRVDDWGTGNLFTVHQWWHLALFHLELDDHRRVLEIYDHHIHHGGSDGVPLELLDASAMLWRLHLDGVDLGERPEVLADAWSGAVDADEGWYAFNDVHAVMAFVLADRLHDAAAAVDRLERTSHAVQGAGAGVPVARALLAFAAGRHDDVIAELWTGRRGLHHFGGSHAQRDVVERTLLESAVRARRHSLADRLISERLTLRPNGRFAHARTHAVGPASRGGPDHRDQPRLFVDGVPPSGQNSPS